LELTLPVDAAAREFYQQSVAAAQGQGVAERYTRSLLGPEPAQNALGFLELAADYGARLTCEDLSSSSEIRLCVDVSLEAGEALALEGTAL
jgi:hypothetical protein